MSNTVAQLPTLHNHQYFVDRKAQESPQRRWLAKGANQASTCTQQVDPPAQKSCFARMLTIPLQTGSHLCVCEPADVRKSAVALAKREAVGDSFRGHDGQPDKPLRGLPSVEQNFVTGEPEHSSVEFDVGYNPFFQGCSLGQVHGIDCQVQGPDKRLRSGSSQRATAARDSSATRTVKMSLVSFSSKCRTESCPRGQVEETFLYELAEGFPKGAAAYLDPLRQFRFHQMPARFHFPSGERRCHRAGPRPCRVRTFAIFVHDGGHSRR